MLETITGNLRRTIKGCDIAVTSLPLVPEISLYLLSADYPRGKLDEDEMHAIMNAPAYWAFCWASGQVLARYILDHPGCVAGKSILDFGSGSGVVAIAAALAGARQVVACDTDPDALDATTANAALNRVSVQVTSDLAGVDPDMAIAADVLYDRDNLHWLDALPALASDVLIADSRIKSLQGYGYEVVDRITATTVPDLDESREFNDVRVYRAVRTPRAGPE